MKTIRDAVQVIGTLERGDVSADLSKKMAELLEILQDQAGPKTKAKGELSLTLRFTVEGPTVEIEAEIKTKAPKPKRGRSFMFVTAAGELSLDHPQQVDMFPRDVDLTLSANR